MGMNSKNWPKKYSHYVSRTDAIAPVIRCTSLAESKRQAECEWELAHYTDKPDLVVCTRDGETVATLGEDCQWEADLEAGEGVEVI